MTVLDQQAEALALLDAAAVRARVVVDPTLLSLVERRIDWLVADGPEPPAPADERESDVAAVIEQMLIDVARLDDDTVRRADRHFQPGGLSDLVTASYVLEARTRLRIAGERLLGSRP
jgi:hypothetical protein